MQECPYSIQRPSSLSRTQQEQRHVVALLLSSFISPYKILHMLDPTQADSFKHRNPSSGCCASPHISIPQDQLTPTEKLLKQMLTPQQVLLHLDDLLSMCCQKMDNIVAKGKEDGLKVEKEVEKFLLDKVMGECSNLYFCQKLRARVRAEGERMSKEMGLWATPASWLQKYPGVELEFISRELMGELMGRGWTIVRKVVKNSKRLGQEALLLEKDGKFEKQVWGRGDRSCSQGQKLLSQPEKYAEMETSDNRFLFAALREAVMVVSAIPFQLNKKANLFCSVSPHLHLCFTENALRDRWGKQGSGFTVLLGVVGQTKLLVDDGKEDNIFGGDLALLDNSRLEYQLSCGARNVLMRNFIEIVGK